MARKLELTLGMFVGTIAVVVAAYLMYQMGWRDED